jgi:adenylosuccinate lyase
MTHDRYSSPLAERYASAAMLSLWSAQTRHGLWRRLWLALAEAERDLGVDIPAAAIAEMKLHLDDIDFAKVAEYEKRFRHDVMAHVHAFGEVAPAARGVIHLGATSAYVTDNGDLIQMYRGLGLLRARVISVLRTLGSFAAKWKSEPTLGYTHLQPAQLTTVGKRATLWMQDLVLDLADLDFRLASLPLRGVKGTTGTQASFLELFKGDHGKVRDLDRRVTQAMGFQTSLPVTGQTYSRKIDAQVLGVDAGIGSSAMAYKRNPMRSERINSLSRFVLSLEPNANQTHSVQFFERTLDDSANRRLSIPEAFLATDAVLILMENIAVGLEVHPARIRARIADELPFMATESLIVRAVEAGGDRQQAHEVIRTHSIASARAMKDDGAKNDMLERLAKDDAFGVPMSDLLAAADPARFIGRASAQVDDFLSEVIHPILQRAGNDTRAHEEVRV